MAIITHSHKNINPSTSTPRSTDIDGANWLEPHVFESGERGSILVGDPTVADQAVWLNTGSLPGQVLTSQGTGELPMWGPSPGEIIVPITDPGDIVVGDASGNPVRLPIGTEGQVLTVQPTGLAGWSGVVQESSSGTWEWHTLPGPGAQASGLAGSTPYPGTPSHICISITTFTGTDTKFLFRILEGDIIVVVDKDDSTKYNRFIVSADPGSPVGNTMVIPVVEQGAQGVGISEGQQVIIDISYNTLNVGFESPMTSEGDLIVGGTAGFAQRLSIGGNDQVLRVVGGMPNWGNDVGFANPMTGAGDIIIGGASGAPMRLAPGTPGFVLTMNGGPSWKQLPPDVGFANPMTTLGDLITGGVSGVATRLGVGSSTQVLTIVGGVPTWQTPASGGMTNPMTTPWDLIVGGVGGAATRFAKGADTQVLTMVGGAIVWTAPVSGGMTNPMTTAGDIIVGAVAGAPARLAKGTDTHVLTLVAGTPAWQAPGASGFANPMTGVGDLIRGGTAGVATRLAPGTNGHFLTLSAGVPAWQALPVDPGFANPMTTTQDLIVGGASGAPGRLAVGSNTHVLTVTGGVVGWAAAVGFANPMTTTGDLIRTTSGSTPARLGIGSAGHVLTVVAGVPAWQALPVDPGFANPMTNVGDLIRGGASGAPTRLAAVATGSVFASAGVNTAPAWSASPTLTGLTLSGLTAGSVVFAGTSGVLSQDNANFFFDDTNNNLRLFGGLVGTSGAKVLTLGNGIAPTTSPADTFQMWAADHFAEAGSASLRARDERGTLFGLFGNSASSGFSASRGIGEIVVGMVADGTIGFVGTTTNAPLSLVTNNLDRWGVDTTGHFIPETTNTYDIGSSTNRARGMYASDLIEVGTASYVGSIAAAAGAQIFRMYAASGYDFNWYTNGPSGTYPGGNGAVGLWNATLGKADFYFTSSNRFYLVTGDIANPRLVWNGSPDSGGAGYRMLVIANS